MPPGSNNYIEAHKAYIRGLYKSIQYSGSSLTRECMFCVIKDEEDKLNRYINRIKKNST